MKKTITLFSLLSILAVSSLHAQTNNALSFDGVDDVVTVTAASSLIASAPGMTLTAWVYPSKCISFISQLRWFCRVPE